MTGKSAAMSAVKRELRAACAAARDRLSPEERSSLASRACLHASGWLAQSGLQTLLAYVPFRSELDCRMLISAAWAEGRDVLLPRVIRESTAMSLHRVSAWEELTPGAYGILEPAECAGAPAQNMPDVVFVPGLAFDLHGGRLGYGRGYYDRMHAAWTAGGADVRKLPVMIGLAFGVQLVPEVPMDRHDAFMDMLITEDGVIPCRKENRSSWI